MERVDHGGESGDGAQRQGVVYAASESVDGHVAWAGYVEVVTAVAEDLSALTFRQNWLKFAYTTRAQRVHNVYVRFVLTFLRRGG